MPETLVEDCAIHYLHYPPVDPTAARRVLYIHGTGCNARVFERHLRVLAETCECVAIDLPGHGRSGGRGFRGVTDYAASSAGLIRALKWENCVVAGHSLGGGIALALALYDPELVSALMLIDTGARLRVAPEILRAVRAAAAAGQAPRSDPRRGFAAATSDAVVADVQASIAGCDPQVVMRDWIADDSCDFMSRLPAIEVPALALCGREDPFTPVKYHEYFEQHLPNCTLVVIDDAGHWPFVEQPARFDAHVGAFLATLA